MHPLRVAGLTKRYGSTTALDDLSFTVGPGRVTGFLGPNGAGKSTTIKILLGLAAADAGSALIGGRHYRDLAEPLATVGGLLERDAFHPGRSGRNHLLTVADAARRGPGRVDEMLGRVGLADQGSRKVGGYSLGMRQRLGLAAALLADPDVLILDEPANGLDPAGIRWLRDLLRQRAAAGDTVFVSSHLLAEVQQLADEVVIVDRGRLVATRGMGELAVGVVRARTPEPGRLATAVRAAGGEPQDGDGDGAVLVGELTAAEVGEVAHEAGVVLHELTQQADSLEELFLTMTAPGGPQAGRAVPPRVRDGPGGAGDRSGQPTGDTGDGDRAGRGRARRRGEVGDP